MYTLIDGVDFYDKNEVDDMVKALTGGVLPDDIGKDLDTRLAAEEAARIQADTDLALAGANLENRITTEEATRAQVDSALNDKIVKESSTRSNSDLMLANQIAAVEQLFTTLIGPNGFIDTDNDTVKVNDSGKSIRQIAHEEFYRQLITDADDIKQQLDTLKELADYLQDNPTVLADMYAKLGISWSLDNPTDFGSFDFSRVLTADNVDDAVLELYNTFTNMIGDLTQLTTTFKDNVVGAINEVDNNVKTKKYVDVYSINFKLDSLANPIVLKDGINHFMLAPTMAYDDVYNVLSKDTKAAVAICDIDVDNKLYAHVDSITETCITFCGTNCITTVPDDGSPVFNTYRDITINWHNDGTAEMLLSRNYLNSRIDTEEAARIQADSDLGDRITAEEVARTQADSDLGDRITAEEAARIQADSDLENKADELDAKIGDLTTLNTVEKGTVVGAINSEFEWRRKNDEAMEERLTDLITAEIAAVERTCSDLDATIKNESRVRVNKDNDITTSIGDMTTLDTTNKITLVGAINEVKTLAEAGGGGGGGGGTGTDTAQLEIKLNSEITAREQADEQLGTRIDTEEAERTQADTNLGNRIDTEEAARTQADTDLGTRIDTEVGDLSTLTTTEKGSVVAAINEVNGKVGTGGGSGTPEPHSVYVLHLTTNTSLNPALNATSRTEIPLTPEQVSKVTNAITNKMPVIAYITDSDGYSVTLPEINNNNAGIVLNYTAYSSSDISTTTYTLSLYLPTNVALLKVETILSSGNSNNITYHYTYVIDSDEALANWANNDKSQGQYYTSVLIRKGEWTSTVGVNLTTTGTKVVVGEAGSKLVFNNVEKGLYYDAAPSTADYYMQGVNVEVTNDAWSGANAYGFYNCINLTNCAGIGTGISGSNANGYGFANCTNLTNCTGTGIGSSVSDYVRTLGYGFANCTNLTNCTGTGKDAAVASENTLTGECYGFTNCTNLTHCTGTGTGTGTVSAGSIGYAFFMCVNLTNCTGTGTGTNEGIGFVECMAVSRCKAGAHCSRAVFYGSYASSGDANNAYECADTANGGFNDTTNPAA